MRAYALADVAAHPALDEVNAVALRSMLGTSLELDTVQLTEQPSFHSVVWAVEIWDVRFLQSPSMRRRSIPPGDHALSVSLAREHLSRPDGSPCAPWRHFDECWACNGSSLHFHSCVTAKSKCSRGESLHAFSVHMKRPELLHADVLVVG